MSVTVKTDTDFKYSTYEISLWVAKRRDRVRLSFLMEIDMIVLLQRIRIPHMDILVVVGDEASVKNKGVKTLLFLMTYLEFEFQKIFSISKWCYL